MESLSEGVPFKLRAGIVKGETERDREERKRHTKRWIHTEMQRGRETHTHREKKQRDDKETETNMGRWTEYSRQVSVCKLWRMGRA